VDPGTVSLVPARFPSLKSVCQVECDADLNAELSHYTANDHHPETVRFQGEE